jgi:hypothetical protein
MWMNLRLQPVIVAHQICSAGQGISGHLLLYCLSGDCFWNLNSNGVPGRDQPYTSVVTWHGLAVRCHTRRVAVSTRRDDLTRSGVCASQILSPLLILRSIAVTICATCVNIQNTCTFAHIAYLCVPYGSHNKQP